MFPSFEGKSIHVVSDLSQPLYPPCPRRGKVTHLNGDGEDKLGMLSPAAGTSSGRTGGPSLGVLPRAEPSTLSGLQVTFHSYR